jgi:hypothetical protein
MTHAPISSLSLIYLFAISMVWGGDSLMRSDKIEQPSPIMFMPDWLASVQRSAPSATAPAASFWYFGWVEDRVPAMVHERFLKMGGKPFVIIPPEQLVPHPITRRPVLGADLAKACGAGPGTLLAVDRDGMPLTGSGLSMLTHGGDPYPLQVWSMFYGSDAFLQTSWPDFIRLMDAKPLIQQMIAVEARGFRGRNLIPTDAIPKGKSSQGAWDIWDHPGTIHLVSHAPTGRAFRMLLSEVTQVAATLNRPVALVIPFNTSKQDVQDLIITAQSAVTIVISDSPSLSSAPSPRVVISGGMPPRGNGQTLEFWGYIPASVLVRQLGFEPPVTTPMNIPLGEVDAGPFPDMK